MITEFVSAEFAAMSAAWPPDESPSSPPFVKIDSKIVTSDSEMNMTNKVLIMES